MEAFLASHDHPSQFFEGEIDHVVGGDPPAQLILRAKALVPESAPAETKDPWWQRLAGGLNPIPAYGWAAALVLLTATGGYFLGAATFEHERTVQVSINQLLDVRRRWFRQRAGHFQLMFAIDSGGWRVLNGNRPTDHGTMRGMVSDSEGSRDHLDNMRREFHSMRYQLVDEAAQLSFVDVEHSPVFEALSIVETSELH